MDLLSPKQFWEFPKGLLLLPIVPPSNYTEVGCMFSKHDPGYMIALSSNILYSHYQWNTFVDFLKCQPNSTIISEKFSHRNEPRHRTLTQIEPTKFPPNGIWHWDGNALVMSYARDERLKYWWAEPVFCEEHLQIDNKFPLLFMIMGCTLVQQTEL